MTTPTRPADASLRAADFEASQGFAFAGEKVLAKEFDGELTLINLSTGVYFAAGGPALDVWQAFVAGRSLAATAKVLSMRYEISETEAYNEVSKLAGLFVHQGLLVPVPARAEDVLPYLTSPRALWTPPWFEDYGDMQDLLLLDPVHYLNAGAWPDAKGE